MQQLRFFYPLVCSFGVCSCNLTMSASAVFLSPSHVSLSLSRPSSQVRGEPIEHRERIVDRNPLGNPLGFADLLPSCLAPVLQKACCLWMDFSLRACAPIFRRQKFHSQTRRNASTPFHSRSTENMKLPGNDFARGCGKSRRLACARKFERWYDRGPEMKLAERGGRWKQHVFFQTCKSRAAVLGCCCTVSRHRFGLAKIFGDH